MTSLVSFLLGQSQVPDQRVAERQAIFQRYREALRGIEGIAFMPEASYGRSTHWLTAITVNPDKCGVTRDHIIDFLEHENIDK